MGGKSEGNTLNGDMFLQYLNEGYKNPSHASSDNLVSPLGLAGNMGIFETKSEAMLPQGESKINKNPNVRL